jgi:hypothetical protein
MIVAIEMMPDAQHTNKSNNVSTMNNNTSKTTSYVNTRLTYKHSTEPTLA